MNIDLNELKKIKTISALKQKLSKINEHNNQKIFVKVGNDMKEITGIGVLKNYLTDNGIHSYFLDTDPLPEPTVKPTVEQLDALVKESKEQNFMTGLTKEQIARAFEISIDHVNKILQNKNLYRDKQDNKVIPYADIELIKNTLYGNKTPQQN